MPRPADLPAPRSRMGLTCAAHRHREQVPIHAHHIWPLYAGGPDVKWNKIEICANAHYAIHDLLDKIEDAGSWASVPWETRRRYGLGVRRLALQGWERMQKQVIL